jgi:hypothetical protein
MFSLTANIELVVSWIREDEAGFPIARHGGDFARLQRFKTLLLLERGRADGFESRFREQFLRLVRGRASHSENQEGESGDELHRVEQAFHSSFFISVAVRIS